MTPRLVRLLVFGAGAASVPFLVVEFFAWARTGRPVGVAALLGRGELFPPTALLAAQGVAAAHALPRRVRETRRWAFAVGGFWTLFSIACAGYVVPFSGATGAAGRVAWGSLAVLAGVVVVSTFATRLD